LLKLHILLFYYLLLSVGWLPYDDEDEDDNNDDDLLLMTASENITISWTMRMNNNGKDGKDSLPPPTTVTTAERQWHEERGCNNQLDKRHKRSVMKGDSTMISGSTCRWEAGEEVMQQPARLLAGSTFALVAGCAFVVTTTIALSGLLR
jgi:hypothetical protein